MILALTDKELSLGKYWELLSATFKSMLFDSYGSTMNKGRRVTRKKKKSILSVMNAARDMIKNFAGP